MSLDQKIKIMSVKIKVDSTHSGGSSLLSALKTRGAQWIELSMESRDEIGNRIWTPQMCF